MRAASLMLWFMAGWTQSANWISARGRQPATAAPMATPTMEDSARGMSITRSGPNRSKRPRVAPKTPPRTPTSSPKTRVRGFSSISWVSPWRMASIRVMTGMVILPPVQDAGSGAGDVVQQVLGPGVGGGLRVLRRVVHLLADLFFQGLEIGVVGQVVLLQVGGQPGEGIPLPPGLHLFPGAVRGVVVVAGVGEEPVGLGLDEARALAGPSPLHRLPHHPVDFEGVVAVDSDAGDAVTQGPVGHVGNGKLLLRRDGDGVAVVLAEKDDGQPVDGGKVDPLVEVALGRGA